MPAVFQSLPGLKSIRPLNIYSSTRSLDTKLRALPTKSEDLELESIDEYTVNVEGQKISVENPIQETYMDHKFEDIDI